MKRTLSLILAALLLASSMTACGNTEPKETENGTATVETSAPAHVETDESAPDPHETDAPAPAYPTNLVTENGAAMAHIVIEEGAEQLLTFAAEELVHHIKLVSGAELSVVNTVQADSLPIIIATPESLPELETLFADDLAWLRQLSEEGTDIRYGDDGFAIRQYDGKLYIFGTTAKGALNGVYDFIEENMGILWLGANEENDTVYRVQTTITVTKVDYREKSPFTYRGYCAGGSVLLTRNKLNAALFSKGNPNNLKELAAIGITGRMMTHDLQSWILSSPIYNPDCTEYWNDLEEGVPGSASDRSGKQINIWSQLTIDTMAASVIAYLDQNDVDNVSIGIEDNDYCKNYPECTLPFEYAPGEFVNPEDEDYLTTVFFTFLNKVTAQIKEKHPDVTINTYAFWWTEKTARCELDDNICLFVAPITKDESGALTDPNYSSNVLSLRNIEGWKAKTKDLLFYDYYFCSNSMPDYERPIWYEIQTNLQYYAESGYLGPMAWIMGDSDSVFTGWAYTNNVYRGEPRTYHGEWLMSSLTIWLYNKLCWNPYEDVDALIVEFCDKVYGAASESMQEYYSLLRKGWTEGDHSFIRWDYRPKIEYYLDRFIYTVELEDDFKTVLAKAYDEVDTVAGKERVGYIKKIYEMNFPDEE